MHCPFRTVDPQPRGLRSRAGARCAGPSGCSLLALALRGHLISVSSTLGQRSKPCLSSGPPEMVLHLLRRRSPRPVVLPVRSSLTSSSHGGRTNRVITVGRRGNSSRRGAPGTGGAFVRFVHEPSHDRPGSGGGGPGRPRTRTGPFSRSRGPTGRRGGVRRRLDADRGRAGCGEACSDGPRVDRAAASARHPGRRTRVLARLGRSGRGRRPWAAGRLSGPDRGGRAAAHGGVGEGVATTVPWRRTAGRAAGPAAARAGRAERPTSGAGRVRRRGDRPGGSRSTPSDAGQLADDGRRPPADARRGVRGRRRLVVRRPAGR